MRFLEALAGAARQDGCLDPEGAGLRPLIEKATVSRWARTLSTMFAAGVPMVEALDSVAGAAGNHVFMEATMKIKTQVSTGSSLTVACRRPAFSPTC
jgi:type IV pilus assembly protein PilC